MPTKYRRRPARAWAKPIRARQRRASAIIPSAIRSAASTRAIESIAALIAASRAGSASSSATSARHRVDRRVGHDDRAPPRSKCCAFSVWWSAVACGYGTRIDGRARRRQLPDRATGARDRDVGGRQDVAELIRLGHQQVVGALDPRSEGGEVALAGDVHDGGPVLAPGRDGHLVQRGRARERAEDGHRRRFGVEAEARARIRTADAEVGDRDRAGPRPRPCHRSAPGSRRPGRAWSRRAPPAGWRARGAHPPR